MYKELQTHLHFYFAALVHQILAIPFLPQRNIGVINSFVLGIPSIAVSATHRDSRPR